jgi:predicted amidohydrolase YtcJ
LDAFEYAATKNKNSSELRHHIAHLQLVLPKDHKRFQQLGVVANFQVSKQFVEMEMSKYDDNDIFSLFLSSMQPFWSHLDDDQKDICIPKLGLFLSVLSFLRFFMSFFYIGEQSRWQYPMKTLQNNGAKLAFGSDW